MPAASQARMRSEMPLTAIPEEEDSTVDQESGALYKTTIIIWTSYPPDDMEIVDLAWEATDGNAHSSVEHTVLVPCPEADPDWDGTEFFDLPGSRAAVRLLCDHCYTAVTGTDAECQRGCRHRGLDDDGACMWPEGPVRCQWCGHAGRLTPVPAGHEGFRNLPAVGERGGGQWWLSWAQDQRGPYPSQDAAWDAWHADAALPAPQAGPPARQPPGGDSGRGREWLGRDL